MGLGLAIKGAEDDLVRVRVRAWARARVRVTLTLTLSPNLTDLINNKVARR